jgi:hypothetical protein
MLMLMCCVIYPVCWIQWVSHAHHCYRCRSKGNRFFGYRVRYDKSFLLLDISPWLCRAMWDTWLASVVPSITKLHVIAIDQVTFNVVTVCRTARSLLYCAFPIWLTCNTYVKYVYRMVVMILISIQPELSWRVLSDRHFTSWLKVGWSVLMSCLPARSTMVDSLLMNSHTVSFSGVMVASSGVVFYSLVTSP